MPRLNWNEALQEALNKDILPPKSDVVYAFHIKEPSKEEIQHIMDELDNLLEQVKQNS